MSERLCLQWNDFQDNIKCVSAFLKEDKDFNDVTLVCEDGQQMEAHKVILASSSPLFQRLLARNKHPHPLIYMRGMRFEQLLAIMNFLYQGEASVFQEDLDSFLVIAEELQLKGLMDQRVENKLFSSYQVLTPLNAEAVFPEPSLDRKTGNNKIVKAGDNTKVAVPSILSSDLDKLEEMVKSMMEKSGNKYGNGRQLTKCKVCGKEDIGSHIKDHIEANHIEGIAVPCSLCGKTSRSRAALRRHIC